MKRDIEIKPAARAAYFSLSDEERRKLKRALQLLAYPPAERPEKLGVFKSRKLPKHFVVRVTPVLRIVYHRPERTRVVIDDIYSRDTFGG